MTSVPAPSPSQADETILEAPVEALSTNPFSWFMRKGYPQGAFWAVMITLVSVTNDILMRFLGAGLDVIQISFFRFFFGMLAVIPLMLSHGTTLFKTSRPWMHFWRAILGVGAIGGACWSVNLMPLSDNTIIMSSQPFFFLPMAAILFAMSDVVAKKMVTTENTHTMLFYFAIGTTLITLVPAILVWQTPSLYQLAMLALLGIGGNLIQVCMIRAFSATEASALSPFRYVEFVFAALFGFVFFMEIPTMVTLAGASFIIAGTAYISYYETRKDRKKAVS